MKGIYKLTSPSGKVYIGQSINLDINNVIKGKRKSAGGFIFKYKEMEERI